jgi:hypothetical protein
MAMDTVEFWTFASLPVIMLALWLWLRYRQHKAKLERERKLACKELILDNRVPLAKRKVDFELLVDLVRLDIRPDQLEKVVELLTSAPVEYHIEIDEEGGGIEVDLDFESKPEQSEKSDSKTKKQPEKEEKKEAVLEEQVVEVVEGMPPEKEKAWLRMAHNRFRHALADKDIGERQARFRMLVKMVELGKKAVQDDGTKPVKRKEYELSLWDRFYENEYLELNQE